MDGDNFSDLIKGCKWPLNDFDFYLALETHKLAYLRNAWGNLGEFNM